MSLYLATSDTFCAQASADSSHNLYVAPVGRTPEPDNQVPDVELRGARVHEPQAVVDCARLRGEVGDGVRQAHGGGHLLQRHGKICRPSPRPRR